MGKGNTYGNNRYGTAGVSDRRREEKKKKKRKKGVGSVIDRDGVGTLLD